MASHALSTLHHVTERKLSKLDHHREQFKADRKAILASAASAREPLQEVEALLKGFERYAITPTQPDLHLANLELFIHQAKHDPSVSPALLRHWKNRLEHELDVVSVKYEYAALFGKLVIDWIKNPNAATTAPGESVADSDSPGEESKAYERIGRKEMHEQREVWESLVFAKKQVDQTKIEAYLNDVFETSVQKKKAKKSPLQILRDSMKEVMDFKSELQTPKKKEDPHEDPLDEEEPDEVRFTIEKLKNTISGVLRSDLLAGNKREGLVALKDQPAVLGELVDVLNMDLDALDQWTWEPTPVPLEMRRQLNGKYRVFMDPEAHQAILLHFIGTTWAVALKQAFTTFQKSTAWSHTPYRSMDRRARDRRDYFLPSNANADVSIQDSRRQAYKQTYFMTQLPNNDEESRGYDDEDVDSNQSAATGATFATKQSLLRLMTTEMLLNSKIYGEFLVLQSDFEWFGPSLPHDTIYAVLRFFGVPEKWLRFFKTFLEAPVVFAQDGSGAQAKTRTCGIPMSFILSDALSEAVLFCLDFAVNKRTKGADLYRFHDDLWFWGQESTCVQGWNALQEFSSVMGLALNKEKTGAALVVANQSDARPLPATLPQQKIKWGFLTLDSTVGRWTADQAKIDEHIEELRRQLKACRSVMAWIQAWNLYVNRFFCTNLAPPTNCFAKPHNDLIISTFENIQKQLFAETGTANVTDHLRAMIKERFGTEDTIPDGFFYFPEQLGGLGLRNALVTAFATYKYSPRKPGDAIDRAFDEEQESYERFKEAFEAGGHQPRRRNHIITGSKSPVEADESFMSFEEFTRYREEVSAPVAAAYASLMQAPRYDQIVTSSALLTALGETGLDATNETAFYWKWICNLYEGDIKQRFGGDGVQLGDRSLLPTGLMDILKSEKVRWDG